MAIEQELSQLFDHYFNSGNRGVRQAQALRMVIEIRQMTDKKKPEDIAPVVRIISDQMCYKFFGTISTPGRLVAVETFFDKAFRVD